MFQQCLLCENSFLLNSLVNMGGCREYMFEAFPKREYTFDLSKCSYTGVFQFMPTDCTYTSQ